MKLRDLGEFGLIQRILAVLPTVREDVLIGPGDDAAVIRPAAGQQIITTDALVEGVDFSLDYAVPDEIGRKAVAVNFSDIAAMGGVPDHVLISWGAPGDADVDTILGIAGGIGAACRDHGAVVIGGDITAASEISITLTVLGHPAGPCAIGYMNARPGNGLYLTGTLGEAALGLLLLQSGDRDRINPFIRRQLVPTPRVREGAALLAECNIVAMTDLSDGLARDLNKLCRASGVGAVIEAKDIPLADGYATAAAAMGRDALELALTGGEDFELLLAVNESNGRPDTASLSAAARIRVTRIGEITEGSGVRLIGADGESRVLPPKGWEHFA